MFRLFLLAAISLACNCLSANTFSAKNFTTTDSLPPVAKPAAPEKKWHERLSIRGYTQFRYNRLLETNPQLKIESTDKSIGDKQGFLFRRGRLILSGDVHERFFVYIQSDFANSGPNGATHYFQIRDAYFDWAMDKKKEFRLRFGQSKVPFGFQNLQSSSNRLAFDRDDALNSAVPSERDLGASVLWAPKKIRDRFKELTNARMKGSGDYGVAAIGIYNGQSMGRPEANNNLHTVAHFTWPFLLENGQFVETSLHAYTGKFVLPTYSKDIVGKEKYEYGDRRVAASLVVYPQPFGFQAEYNVGTGPEFDPISKEILQKNLSGGYFMATYALPLKAQLLMPFCRYQWYEGGKKVELDARSTTVSEWEFGVEWQIQKFVELTASYMVSDRRFEDFILPVNEQKGNLLRLQLQFNY